MCDFYVDGGTKILWLVVILEEDQIRSRHICKPWSHIDVNSVTFSLLWSGTLINRDDDGDSCFSAFSSQTNLLYED